MAGREGERGRACVGGLAKTARYADYRPGGRTEDPTASHNSVTDRDAEQ